jgi:hypothetical protein
MRPVNLILGGVKDPIVLAALLEIQRASNDTLQNDTSSSGGAIATMTGATLASGGPELPYFTDQYHTAFAALTAFGRSLIGAASAGAASAVLPSSVKFISFARDMTLATGNVSYTGVGFAPRGIVFFGIANNGAVGFTIGADDGTFVRCYTLIPGTTWGPVGSFSIFLENPTTADKQQAKVNSFDADGFTLGWQKAGSPTGTADIIAVCFR